MSGKWTKGPWEAERTQGDLWWVDGPATNICDLYHAYVNEDGAIEHVRKPNDKANAHLIAAAPELARALEAAAHALRSYQYGNSSTELAMSVADFADAALAKARGEQS